MSEIGRSKKRELPETTTKGGVVLLHSQQSNSPETLRPSILSSVTIDWLPTSSLSGSQEYDVIHLLREENGTQVT